MERLTFLIILVCFTGCLPIFTQNCMKCICQIAGCSKEIGRCHVDVGSLSCGPYQIKNNYWIDCYKPGDGWQSCTKEMACSETCVKAYMKRYGTYCTGGREPVCEDYARIHGGGPKGCTKNSTLTYWAKVKQCCDVAGDC